MPVSHLWSIAGKSPINKRPSLHVVLAASGDGAGASTVGEATLVAVGSAFSWERPGPPQAANAKTAKKTSGILRRFRLHVVVKERITNRKLRPARQSDEEGQSPDDSMTTRCDSVRSYACQPSKFARATARIYFRLFSGA